MKQSFTHRLPSHLTLLSDPWPEDFSEIQAKVEQLQKTVALPRMAKSVRRKPGADRASS